MVIGFHSLPKLREHVYSSKSNVYKRIVSEIFIPPTYKQYVQYTTGDRWRNNSRKNEGTEPKQKQYPAVDVTGDRNKVQCCKEQYCTGTCNVRSMNQGKLEVVKQEMARVNVDILGISELNGLEWVNLTQMTIISTIVGRNPSEEME